MITSIHFTNLLNYKLLLFDLEIQIDLKRVNKKLYNSVRNDSNSEKILNFFLIDLEWLKLRRNEPAELLEQRSQQ